MLQDIVLFKHFVLSYNWQPCLLHLNKVYLFCDDKGVEKLKILEILVVMGGILKFVWMRKLKRKGMMKAGQGLLLWKYEKIYKIMW